MTTGRRDNPVELAAFTLLELILVMVLVTVLLGVTAPSLRGFHSARRGAEGAAQLLSLANYARSQAIVQGTIYRLNIELSEGTYWLTAQVGGAQVMLRNEQGRRFRLPDGVAVAIRSPAAGNEATYVQFYPSGRSDQATIELVGLQGEVFRVTSPSATERFRIVSPSQVDDS